MIRYISHSEIDKNKWDLCIEQSETPLVYGLSWYLDVVSPQWEALVWNEYEAVMPLPARKKFIFSYLSQPFFCQQTGIFSRGILSADLIATFLQHIPGRFRFADIHLHEGHAAGAEENDLKKRRNYVLSIQRSYDKVQKGYGNQIRRNLKKASKAELSFKTVDAAEVIQLYRQCKGEVTYVLKNEHYVMLQQLLNAALKNKVLFCKGVYNAQGKLLSAGAYLVYKQRVIFLLGTANQEGRDKGAMTLLMDQMIMQFCQQAAYFDFEGSEIQGIARFYKGFGAEKRPYFRYRYNRLPWYIKWLKA